jgi:hypothetical protein
MTKSNEIQNELNLLSPYLASIEKVNCFKLPVASSISISSTIAETDNLELALLNAHKILPGFEIPADFFDIFYLKLIEKRDTTKPLNLQSDSFNASGFVTPPLYFENRVNQLLKNIIKPRLETNVFKVPDNYFETLQIEIPAIQNQNTNSQIISFHKTKWWIAACLIGITTIGLGLLNINNNSLQPTNTAQNTELLNYLNNNEIDISDLNNGDGGQNEVEISPDDINNYLETNFDEGTLTELI